MKSIIEEFYYGNITPHEKSVPFTKEYDKAIKRFLDNEEKLMKILNEPEKSMFSELLKAESQLISLTAVENFKSGFSFGALFMLEILQNNKS